MSIEELHSLANALCDMNGSIDGIHMDRVCSGNISEVWKECLCISSMDNKPSVVHGKDLKVVFEQDIYLCIFIIRA